MDVNIIWDYIKLPQGVRILKAWGEGRRLEVPEKIEGLPVTEIGPYAFSAAVLPGRFQVNEAERRRALAAFGALEAHELEQEPAERRAVLSEAPVSGNRLQEIRLPVSLQAIGDYAFYGCRELERISFADSIVRIGSGAFMGCAKVNRLEFEETGSKKEIDSLCQMLSELRYAMEIIIKKQDGEQALMVPEYYESSVENIPARILELHYQGTGYRYRQCFRSGGIDYREYDRLFGLAKSQEPIEVLAKLACNRIRYPESLSEEAKKAYLEWFSANVREAGGYFLKKDDLSAIRLICGAGGFDGRTGRKTGRQNAEKNRKIVADGAGDFYMASMGEDVLGEDVLGEGVLEEMVLGKTVLEGAASGTHGEAALDVLLEMAGRMGRAEIVSFLMDYRHQKQGSRRKKMFEL